MEVNEHIAWAAGILEGEGCFSMFKRKGKDYHQCSIFCEMTDEDTVRKLQKVLNVGGVSYRAPRRNRKETWIFSTQKQADVFDTLIKVMPYLGERRLDKTKQMFDYLENRCT